MDPDNFEFQLADFHVVMENGELSINDTNYEYDDDDPTYAFVRWIAQRMGA